jgi:hypothetical protein
LGVVYLIKLAVKIIFRAIGFVIYPIIAIFHCKSVDVFQKDQMAFDRDCGEEKKGLNKA